MPSSLPADSAVIKTGSLVPRTAILDRFTEHIVASRGIDLLSLEPLTTITVRTRNSLYRIVTGGGTSVIVQGGRFFPGATRARLDGSGFGGSFLKVAWIGIGMRMEIFANGERIITSPVHDIAVEAARRATTH